MLFNSFQFFLFFPVVTTLYFLIPHAWRWLLLLAASCLFYMAFIPVYILILGFTIVVDYFAGRAIEHSSGKKRRYWLIASLIANVGVLAFFKYFNFLNANVSVLASWLHWNYPVGVLNIILPIGLSFHTFQAMSYTIEVFRGKQKAERHFGIYALYVMFYPQLVAGPIERPQNLLHQFREEHKFDDWRVIEGLRLMLWGFFKKMVVADRVAVVVNEVYNHPGHYHGFAIIAATLLFSIQIYADFSAYSDIARGAARVMGFRLMENFHMPYFSSSVQEFWRRWHISLSTWFRDYLFLPVAFSASRRLSKSRYLGFKTDWIIYSKATLVVMLICGLWHGASWTFVVWGGIHGLLMIAEQTRKSFKWPRWPKPFGVLITFLLVSMAWIFFRATTLSEAYLFVVNIFHTHTTWGSLTFIPVMREFRFTLIFVGIMLVSEYVFLHQGVIGQWFARQTWFRWCLYFATIWIILIYGQFGNQQFIYFQF